MTHQTVGFVGAGRIAEFHIEAARNAGATIAGIVASTPARSREAATRWDVGHAFGTVEELLDDSTITAVHIVTPNALHVGIASDALARGKNVVCEKPLGISAAESARLQDVAEASGRRATVCLTYRYYPAVQAARRLIEAGELGEIHSFRASYLQGWGVSEVVGWQGIPHLNGPSRVIADIGTHLLDLVEFTTGHRIESLAASARTVDGGRQLDDIASMILLTDGGAIGTALLSQVARGHLNSVEIELTGSQGSLMIGRGGDFDLKVARDGAFEVVAVPGSAGPRQDALAAFSQFVADSYDYFDGADVAVPDIAAGHHSAQLVDAALLSAHAARWITVGPAHKPPRGGFV